MASATSPAESVSAKLRELYGEDPARDEGVLHVVAAWQAPDGRLPVLAIGPSSPASPRDAFALRAARMRADAIVTTGRILRDEPDVTHAERDAALLAWRRERVGRAEPPRSVVLTTGAALDARHPLLRADPPPWLATGRAHARALRAAAPGLETIELEPPSLRALLDALARRGARTTLVEAGPSTARALYDAPVAVDELLLSILEEPAADDPRAGGRSAAPALAGELPAPAALDAALGAPRHASRWREPSGEWRFERRRRDTR